MGTKYIKKKLIENSTKHFPLIFKIKYNKKMNQFFFHLYHKRPSTKHMVSKKKIILFYLIKKTNEKKRGRRKNVSNT